MSTPGTYENIKTVALATKFNYRRGSYLQDSYLRNGYLEAEPEGAYAVKRPGLKVLIDFVTQSGYTPALGTPLASYNFQGAMALGNGVVYFMISGREFYLLPAGAAPATLTELPASGVGTSERLQAVAPVTAGAVPWQGSAGIYRAGAAVVPVGITGLVPSLCQLDNTYYVLTTDGSIRASAVSNIASWPALNSVQVFSTVSAAVAMVKHLQYLLAFSTLEIKAYYDAGISPGAPIAQESSFISHVGVPFAASQTIQRGGDILYFLGITTANVLGVYAMSGLQVQKITTPEVDRFLADNFTEYLQVNGRNQSATSLTAGIRAFTVESGGHSFYILTCPTGSIPGTTLVYDIGVQTWYLWDQLSGGGVAELLGVANAGMTGVGLSFIPGDNNGKIYELDPETWQDAGQAITFEVQTSSNNWGNSRTKLIAATYVNSDTLNTSYLLSWTDDDYATYSTPQTISAVNSKKQLIRCGSTIERAWKITHTDNTPMRLFGLEVEVMPGAL